MANKNKQRTALFDGTKSVDLWNGDRGWDISGPASDGTRKMAPQDYFVAVPWFYRAVKDRATSVKKVAFVIVNDKGDDVDASATWQDELGIFPYPRRLIHQIEESLVMIGKAYLFLETNPFGFVKAVKYCLPTSISEVYDDSGELIYYERRLKNRKQRVEIGNIVAIYDPDYTVENGPGASSCGKAALLAAGVLFNTDVFIAQYFKRGAIKATILSVDTSDQKEANRLQAWWEDVIGGIKNAWAALVIRAKTAVPTIIGEGLEGLQNTELTKEKRQDVSTAIGVPESRMWSSAANYATADIEDQKYFDDVITPECWIIEEALNAQLFTAEHHMDGYRWEFRPETNKKFSKDEVGRATAYRGYTAAGMKPSIAAQICGIELPGEMEYSELDPEPPEPPDPADTVTVIPTEAPQALPAPDQQLPSGMSDSQAIRSALFTWKSACLAAVKTGHNAGIDFDNPAIPEPVFEFLHYELDAANDTQTVNLLFKKAREMCKAEMVDPYLVELKRSNDLLERSLA